jgi:hypothetical protein
MAGALPCGISTSDTTLARLTRPTLRRTRSALSRLVGAALSPHFHQASGSPGATRDCAAPRAVHPRSPALPRVPRRWPLARLALEPLRCAAYGRELARGATWPGCAYSKPSKTASRAGKPERDRIEGEKAGQKAAEARALRERDADRAAYAAMVADAERRSANSSRVQVLPPTFDAFPQRRRSERAASSR